MLDFPGSSVKRRASYFDLIEQTMLASSAMAKQPRRISRYLNIARQFINEPLRIGIVGEVNSGKTELANLILGVQVLPSSVINNTQCPTLIRFGEVAAVREYRDRRTFDKKDASDLHRLVQRNGHLVECQLPLPLLKSIEIVDFPSFDNFDPYHENSGSLLRRNHLLIWCSSSIRTWTASEKTAWDKLPGELKHYCLFVITHTDKISARALDAVMERLILEAGPFTLQPVPIAITSAIQARSPRGQIVNRNLWETSGGVQFFKKLADMLQQSLVKRQQRLDDSLGRLSVEASAVHERNGGPHLLAEWDVLRERFMSAETGPEDLDAVIQAISKFKITTCKPWLQSQNRSENEIEDFFRLLPSRLEDIPLPMHQNPKDRLSMVFQQIEGEMMEYISFVECRK